MNERRILLAARVEAARLGVPVEDVLLGAVLGVLLDEAGVKLPTGPVQEQQQEQEQQERRRLADGVRVVLVAVAAVARLVAGAGVRVGAVARAARGRERRRAVVRQLTGGPTRGPNAATRFGRSGVLPMTT